EVAINKSKITLERGGFYERLDGDQKAYGFDKEMKNLSLSLDEAKGLQETIGNSLNRAFQVAGLDMCAWTHGSVNSPGKTLFIVALSQRNSDNNDYSIDLMVQSKPG